MRRFDFWYLLVWFVAALVAVVVGVAINHDPLCYSGLGVLMGLSIGESVWKGKS